MSMFVCVLYMQICFYALLAASGILNKSSIKTPELLNLSFFLFHLKMPEGTNQNLPSFNSCKWLTPATERREGREMVMKGRGVWEGGCVVVLGKLPLLPSNLSLILTISGNNRLSQCHTQEDPFKTANSIAINTLTNHFNTQNTNF